MIPKCPIHKSEMQLSTKGKNKGGYFCPRKNEDGSWCKQNVPAPSPTAPTMTNQDIRSAALEFAGRIYQGRPQDTEFAINLAKRILAEF